MNWLSYAVVGLFLLACGASGSLALLLRARGISRREKEHGIVTPRLGEIASVLGALAGLTIGAIVPLLRLPDPPLQPHRVGGARIVFTGNRRGLRPSACSHTHRLALAVRRGCLDLQGRSSAGNLGLPALAGPVPIPSPSPAVLRHPNAG